LPLTRLTAAPFATLSPLRGAREKGKRGDAAGNAPIGDASFAYCALYSVKQSLT